jgi:hypothetical protein
MANGSVRAKKRHSRNCERDRVVEAVDKLLDRIVADIFRRRPRKEVSIVGPKENRGGLPVHMRVERKQGSTPVIYALPSWRKKLKGKLPDNVSKATKLQPIKGTGIICANDAQIVSGAHSLFPLVSRDPRLDRGRKDESF